MFNDEIRLLIFFSLQNYSKRQHVMATKLNELHATYTNRKNERVVVIVGDGQFPTMRGNSF
jgi:hypothetical protein